MKVPRVPAGLIAAGVLTGAGGIALVGKGAKDLDVARKQVASADARHQARVDESNRRKAETNDRVAAFGRIQEECLAAVVVRMSGFLRRHQKQVRDNERLLVDGVDVTTQLLATTFRQNPADAVAWLSGAAGSVFAGTGTSGAVNKLANDYGVAGTGRKISTLAGAAKERAAKAFLGGGPKANGGGGMALGETALKFVTFGPGLLATGLVTKTMGVRALADAQNREAKVEVWCAELDLADSALAAVEQRADELTELLNKLRPTAVHELDALEAVPFDPDHHSTQLQKAMMLVLAVRDVAITSLLTPDGAIDEQSETLIVKYRPMTKEPDHE